MFDVGRTNCHPIYVHGFYHPERQHGNIWDALLLLYWCYNILYINIAYKSARQLALPWFVWTVWGNTHQIWWLILIVLIEIVILGYTHNIKTKPTEGWTEFSTCSLQECYPKYPKFMLRLQTHFILPQMSLFPLGNTTPSRLPTPFHWACTDLRGYDMPIIRVLKCTKYLNQTRKRSKSEFMHSHHVLTPAL